MKYIFQNQEDACRKPNIFNEDMIEINIVFRVRKKMC